MRSIITLTLTLTGLLWTFGLASLTVFHYFSALFNGYQVPITINEYGEYIYETPLIMLVWPIMLFSTVFCLRLVARRARAIDLPMEHQSSYNAKLGTEKKTFELVKEPAYPSKSPIAS